MAIDFCVARVDMKEQIYTFLTGKDASGTDVITLRDENAGVDLLALPAESHQIALFWIG